MAARQEELSMRMKIILLSAVIMLSFAIFSSILGIVTQSTPYMRGGEYEILEISSTGKEISNMQEAVSFVHGREGEVNITIYDLKYNTVCEGFEYILYVHEPRNLKYVLCQKGNYTVYHPAASGSTGLIDPIKNILLGMIEGG